MKRYRMTIEFTADSPAVADIGMRALMALAAFEQAEMVRLEEESRTWVPIEGRDET